MTGVYALAFMMSPPGLSEFDLEVAVVQAMLTGISPGDSCQI